MNNYLRVVLAALAGVALLSVIGCAVRVKGRERPLVTSNRISGKLKLTMEQESTVFKSSGSSYEDKSSLMKEELFLDTNGDVFDPKLLTYVAGIGLGLSQQTYETEVASGSSYGEMNSYHLGMNFLSGKTYPTNVDLRKRDDYRPRRFQSPLRVQSTDTSVVTLLRIPEWPMSLSYGSSESVSDSDFGSSFDEYKQTSERFGYSLKHDFSERSHLTFRTDKNENEMGGGSYLRASDRWGNRLLHDLVLGDSGQHSLKSSISFVERTDMFGGQAFESQTLDWKETLRLRHSDSLSSFYNTYYSNRTFLASEAETIGGSMGLSHLLYDNFRSSFDVFSSQTEMSSGAESTSYGGNASFNYSRNNRWGRFSSGYTVGTEMQKNTGLTGTDVVTGELHVFNDPFPVELDEINVVINSIVVTNSTGTEVYTEGDDYTIQQTGDRVELIMTTLGADFPNVTDGQDILVDYLIVVEGSLEQDTFHQYFRIEQEFTNGVRVYYSRKTRDMGFDSANSSGLKDQETQTDMFGFRYNGKFFSLSGNHSTTESNEHSVESNTIVASGRWPLNERVSINGLVSQSWIESSGVRDTETSLFKAKGGVRSRLTRYLRLSGEVELREADSSTSGRSEGLTFRAELQYNRRALNMRTGWETHFLDYQNRERTSSNFYIRLIRQF